MTQPVDIAVTLDLGDESATDGLIAEGIDPTWLGRSNATLTFQVESYPLDPGQPSPPAQIPLTFESNNGTFYTRGTVMAGMFPI